MPDLTRLPALCRALPRAAALTLLPPALLLGGALRTAGAQGRPAPARTATATAAPIPTPTAANGWLADARDLTADQQVRQALGRLSFGARPGDVERVRRMGVDTWIEEQLHPERIADSSLAATLAALPTLGRPAAELIRDYPPPGQLLAQAALRNRLRGDTTATMGGTPGQPALALGAADSAMLRRRGRESYRVLGELQTARVARAVASERQLLEVMTDFWANHFNVFGAKDRVRYYLPEYEATLRAHALGDFRTLLGAVAKSPAMLLYLDNWQSVADSARPTLAGARRPGAMRPGAMRPGALRGAGVGLPPALADAVGDARSIAELPPRVRARVERLPAEQRERLERYLALSPAERARLQDVAQQVGQQVAARRPRGLNENYARELMELHTLGVDGGYTQQDVIEVARALTGWTVRGAQQGGDFVFRPEVHDAGEKTILGQRFAAGRGIEDGEQVLDLLARHPSTARFIARKLAVRFVSDSPSPALVERAAATFTRTNGDIRATLATILHDPEFFSRAAYRAKVKTPFELVASAARALGAQPDTSPRTAQLIARLGQPIYGHQAPDGWPEDGASWMNTGAILNRINFGTAVAANRLPGASLAAWPAARTLRTAPRETQIDGIVAALLGGEASADTRAVLASGENPLARRAAAVDTLLPNEAMGMASNETSMRGAGGDAREPRRRQGGMRGDAAQVAREAVKPGRGQPPFAGLAPRLDPFAQLVGLAIGAPEFQRR